MFPHDCNALLQRARHLRGRERAVHEPVRIGVIPYQAVSPNFHAVSLCEAHDLSLAKVERTGALTGDPPLHFILRFHHVEFASPAWPSKRGQKIARVERLTPRASGLARPQVATKWRSLTNVLAVKTRSRKGRCRHAESIVEPFSARIESYSSLKCAAGTSVKGIRHTWLVISHNSSFPLRQ